MINNKLVHGGDIYSHKEAVIDFSANINPFGLPSSVRQAIVDNIDSYVNYPDPLCRELKSAIAKHENVLKSNIVCGNGAADVIFRLVLAVKPDKAMIIVPTFAEYEQALKVCDCDIVYHFLLEQDGFILNESIFDNISNDVDMMFICNPNNPTGIPIKKEFILKIANKCKENNILLVVDECFNEFVDDEKSYSVVYNLQDNTNIIVLKAFTKMYAMAGIRLGYALCSNTILIDKISNTLQPWSVSTVASKCGIAALKEKDYVQKTKLLIERNRNYLINELEKIGFVVYGSKANYVFFKSCELNLVEKLEQHNILIRSCENYVGLEKGYYRIAVKNQEDNQYLIDCLKKVVEQCQY